MEHHGEQEQGAFAKRLAAAMARCGMKQVDLIAAAQDRGGAPG